MITNSFDKIAKAYNRATPAIPQEYLTLLHKTFKIKSEDRVVDLGCGSGALTLEFAKKSSFVKGVDSSKTMIDIAKKEDIQKKVTWINKSAENFDIGVEKYNLIISYESFHLFPNHIDLIQKCARGLKSGGSLCVGWVMYEWDLPLKSAIKEVFAANGLSRGIWGLWTCPSFPDDVIASKSKLSFPQKKEILIKSRSTIDVIVTHILNNSKSASLNNDIKLQLAKDLTQRFLKIYPSGESEGFARYSFWYSTK